jgi:DNA polymerase-3 subunit delta'
MSFSSDKAYELIAQAHDHGRLAHAYLIAGPEGSGKHALAERIIRRVNRVPGDLTGLDSMRGPLVHLVRPESKSRRITIDSMRAAEHTLQMSVAEGATKFVVVDDCDRMGPEAENAFLKTLEEPPKASVLLMVTSQPELLLDTILSRCIRIYLKGPRGGLPHGEAAGRLLEALRAHFEADAKGIPAAMGLMGIFTEVLKDEKAAIGKRHDEALKLENDHYKKTTEGDWLKKRDEFYEALTVAEYLQFRSRLLEYLVAWFGDALRLQSGGVELDLPAYAEVTARVAKRFGGRDLDQKIDEIEKLRAHLNTNVSETLALEVAFVRAFG